MAITVQAPRIAATIRSDQIGVFTGRIALLYIDITTKHENTFNDSAPTMRTGNTTQHKANNAPISIEVEPPAPSIRKVSTNVAANTPTGFSFSRAMKPA